jgi:DNA-binding protein HU-beta
MSILPGRVRQASFDPFYKAAGAADTISISQKEALSMAKKPTKKSAAAKSRAAKAPTPKATPNGKNDRQHLIGVIQAGTGCTGVAARNTMNALLGTIATSLKKNQRVQLPGFGSFVVTKRAARKGVNPRTGEAIKIKASKSVRCKAGQPLKSAV